MTDHDLLQQYAHTRDGAAFAQLVHRHLPLVYAAARRQLQDPHLAEDVAQAVFLVLARKAATLPPTAVLPAWLLVTTRLTCNDARKRATRRRLHEERAAAMTPTPPTATPFSADPDHTAITPHLDDALAALPAHDRDALVLRFFQQQPLRAVGAALHISEDAAEKRIARALEKLRAFFARRNLSLSVAAIPAAIAQHADVPVSPALNQSVIAAAAAHAGSPAALALAKSTLHALFWTPGKVAAALLLAVTSATAFLALSLPQTTTPASAASTPSGPSSTPPTPPTPPTSAPAAPAAQAHLAFAPEIEHPLRTTPNAQITFIDLDNGKAFPPPFPLTPGDILAENPPQIALDFTPDLKAWIEKNNISLAVVTAAAKDGDRLVAVPLYTRTLLSNRGDANTDALYTNTTPAFIHNLFTIKPEEACKILNHDLAWFDPNSSELTTLFSALQYRFTTLPTTLFFHTRAGTAGILQLRGKRPEDTFPQALSLRYKRLPAAFPPATTAPKPSAPALP